MTKAELRTLIHARLAALSPEERARKSRQLCDSLTANPSWHTARSIALYSPLPTEPDTGLLWSALAPPRRAFYPRVHGETLAFYHTPTPAALYPSRWGLLEPAGDTTTLIPPAELDLIIVPGIAFTRDGHRMGRGRGFYDRFLPLCPEATLISLCFEEQLVPALPMESHDIPVHHLFTA